MATYFDTADFRLWARGITLRHRTGEDEGTGRWTLKLPQPSSGPTLDRTELEWEGSPEFIPEAVHEIVGGITRRAVFEKVTTLETIRRRLILQGGRQIVLAEVDDDLVTIHGGSNDGGWFRQIEVELNEADGPLLQACVDRLREAGARIDDRGPKLARALDEDALGTDQRSLGPKSTIADVVRASIRSGLDRILDHEYVLRLSDGDPPVEAIHQTRVATRRLRSDLQTFKDVLDPVWVTHIRADLKWLGGELGLVRDADVLGEHLGLGGGPTTGATKGLSGLRDELRGQRQQAAERVANALQSERYLRLLDRLSAATDRPPLVFAGHRHHGLIAPDERAARALRPMVKRPWKQLKKKVKAAGGVPTDRQLHQVRIAAKRLRYAAEAAEPVVGKRARRVATAAERLQARLGDHHDAVVAEAWLRDQAKGAPSKVAFSAGLLAAEQIRRQQQYRHGWQARWKRADRRTREWLG